MNKSRAVALGHTNIVIPAAGRQVHIIQVPLASEADIDQFYVWAKATRVVVIQAIPPPERRICAFSEGGVACTRPATAAVIRWDQAKDLFDEATACTPHLVGAAVLEVHGPDTTSPRPRWN